MKPVKPIVPGIKLPVTEMAKNQPEYQQLPVFRNIEGVCFSRWKLSFRERLAVLFRGDVYMSICTFNQPLQPSMLQVTPPTRGEMGMSAALYYRSKGRRVEPGLAGEDRGRRILLVVLLALFCGERSLALELGSREPARSLALELGSREPAIGTATRKSAITPDAALVSARRSGSSRVEMRGRPAPQDIAVRDPKGGFFGDAGIRAGTEKCVYGHPGASHFDFQGLARAVTVSARPIRQAASRESAGAAGAYRTIDLIGDIAAIRAALLEIELSHDWKLADESQSRMRFSRAPRVGAVSQAAQDVAGVRLIFRDSFTFVVRTAAQHRARAYADCMIVTGDPRYCNRIADGAEAEAQARGDLITVRASTELCTAPASHDSCPDAKLTKAQAERLDKVLASLKSAVSEAAK